MSSQEKFTLPYSYISNGARTQKYSANMNTREGAWKYVKKVIIIIIIFITLLASKIARACSSVPSVSMSIFFWYQAQH